MKESILNISGIEGDYLSAVCLLEKTF